MTAGTGPGLREPQATHPVLSGEARLSAALRNLAGAGMVRFDTRAAITIILTLAVVFMAVSEHEIPKELAYPYATILGWWFPRPQEGAAR